TVFNDALWFNGSASVAEGNQLFKLGNDGSVTKWTSIGTFLQPTDLTVFNNALWFNGINTTNALTQLDKLGFNGSVTKWTANPGGGFVLPPHNMIFYNNELCFGGESPAAGFQLYKLGNDGSVTQWTDIGANFAPQDLTVFNNALWFDGFNTGQSQL